MFKRLFKTKTFWGALAAVIAAAERYFTGSASLQEALQLGVPAILALFVRDGIAKASR
ncbi:hypothetical protein GF324_07330 [bacterium]|nr:hypothetical protein [bacterium]